MKTTKTDKFFMVLAWFLLPFIRTYKLISYPTKNMTTWYTAIYYMIVYVIFVLLLEIFSR